MLYKCLNCKSKSHNVTYANKHIIKTKHNFIQYCSFCYNIYSNNHYSKCPVITNLLFLTFR